MSATIGTLRLGRPIDSRRPDVALPVDLAPGRYRVQLVVSGARGASQPAELVIEILAPNRGPTKLRRPMITPR